MRGYIDGIDFLNMEAMKYYSVPNTWSPERKKENAVSKIFSSSWWGAQKRDGIFMMLIIDEDGNIIFRPRSKNVKGEFVDKKDWVPHLMNELFQSLPKGTCLLGELYLPRDEQAKSTSAVMNSLKDKAIKRQEKEEDKLHYYIFDILADEGKSLVDTPALERFNLLHEYYKVYGNRYHFEWAKYCNGKELWDLLQQLLADGYEGVVITNENAKYQPGKRSNSVSLKIKKELQDTIDCIMCGANAPSKLYTGKEIETWPYWFDELTNKKIQVTDFTKNETYKSYIDGAPVVPVTKNWFYGWAGSWKLGLYKGRGITEIGNLSGITDEMKQNWKDYVGKVLEVTAMEIMDTHGLRHPKLVRVRDDKSGAECTWESVFHEV